MVRAGYPWNNASREHQSTRGSEDQRQARNGKPELNRNVKPLAHESLATGHWIIALTGTAL